MRPVTKHTGEALAHRMSPARITKTLVFLGVLGMALRIVLAAVSTGSYDAVLWREFATHISERGLIELYRVHPHFNHPPIPGWWASSSLAIANVTALPFEFVFKLPMIASDGVVCILLWRIWSRRRSPRFAAAIVAMYAWNLCALLLSAYHCNTDSIYAMLVLLAVYLIEEHRAHFAGGLALAAAINMKLTPLLLIIPMLGAYRDPRLAARFLAGLTIGATPFLVPLLGAGTAFVRNALGYTSMPTYWGVNLFLREMVRIPRFSAWAQPLMDHYHDLGRWLMVLTILLFTLVTRRRNPDMDRYTACAATAGIFLILAPGFAMQYSVLPIPLMMVVAPMLCTLYGTIAGVGLFFIYWLGWTGTVPFASTLGVPDDAAPSTQLGLMAWAALIAFVWNTLRGRDAIERH